MYDVITVGSNTLDAFVHTDVELIRSIKKGKNKTKELLAYPLGSKIIINELEFFVGGGGINTASSFKKLGLKTAYLGKIGRDENGVKILSELNRANIDFIGTFGKQSGYSVVLDSIARDRTILTHKGSNDNFKYGEIDKNKLKTKWFYFSSMMGQSFETLKSLSTFSQKNNIKIAFNPSNYLVQKGITELKPVLDKTNMLIFNKEEAIILTKKRTMDDAFKSLIKIIKPDGLIVITDGARGVYSYDGKTILHALPTKVTLVETTGAGDAFASAFTAAIIAKKTLKEALKMGMIQAEAVIRCKGANKNLLNKKEMTQKLKTDKRKIVAKKLEVQ